MPIALKQLPAAQQKEIIAYLEAGDFVTAKHKRDEYEKRFLKNVKKEASRLRLAKAVSLNK